jgi:hypothetical protein
MEAAESKVPPIDQQYDAFIDRMFKKEFQLNRHKPGYDKNNEIRQSVLQQVLYKMQLPITIFSKDPAAPGYLDKLVKEYNQIERAYLGAIDKLIATGRMHIPDDNWWKNYNKIIEYFIETEQDYLDDQNKGTKLNYKQYGDSRSDMIARLEKILAQKGLNYDIENRPELRDDLQKLIANFQGIAKEFFSRPTKAKLPKLIPDPVLTPPKVKRRDTSTGNQDQPPSAIPTDPIQRDDYILTKLSNWLHKKYPSVDMEAILEGSHYVDTTPTGIDYWVSSAGNYVAYVGIIGGKLTRPILTTFYNNGEEQTFYKQPPDGAIYQIGYRDLTGVEDDEGWQISGGNDYEDPYYGRMALYKVVYKNPAAGGSMDTSTPLAEVVDTRRGGGGPQRIKIAEKDDREELTGIMLDILWGRMDQSRGVLDKILKSK